MSALTLPGDIPGLLRRGSPVVLATRTYGGSVFLDGARGVVCSDGGRVGTETLGGSPVLVSTSPRDLALDLTDATGRAHAAWWLQAQGWGVSEAAIERIAGTDDAAAWLDWWFCGAEEANPERIAGLRDVVLCVAGRAP